MHTSELAGQAGVNPETLRYYERRGLLDVPARSSGGFRDYPAALPARGAALAGGTTWWRGFAWVTEETGIEAAFLSGGDVEMRERIMGWCLHDR